MKRLLVSTAVIFAFTAGTTTVMADPPATTLGSPVTLNVQNANASGSNFGQFNVIGVAIPVDSGRGNGSEPSPENDVDPGVGNTGFVPGNEGGD